MHPCSCKRTLCFLPIMDIGRQSCFIHLGRCLDNWTLCIQSIFSLLFISFFTLIYILSPLSFSVSLFSVDLPSRYSSFLTSLYDFMTKQVLGHKIKLWISFKILMEYKVLVDHVFSFIQNPRWQNMSIQLLRLSQ